MIKRSAGILLPLSSLPSPHGIGTMGRAAYEFADFLAAAGQRYWQLLPLGPTSYGDSPYQSFSSFAGNPYFIDLDLLAGSMKAVSRSSKGLRRAAIRATARRSRPLRGKTRPGCPITRSSWRSSVASV